MGRRSRVEPTPDALVDLIVADERVTWFPVRHHSPVCALQVERAIEAIRPAAVLVEGPDDATDHIPWLVHADARPPLAILSTWVDVKNELGRNGVLSPSEDVPARYRGWWPFPGFGPELAALRTGARVGARLAFIDVPLKGALPFTEGEAETVSGDPGSESAFFDALAARRGFPSFAAFWDATFESGATGATPEAFRKALLLFAACARALGTPETIAADGSIVREQHMRWHVENALAEVEGPIVVVVGAWHAVALPFTKKRRAKAKADRHARTMPSPHSYRALARLVDGLFPGWAEKALSAARAGDPAPLTTTATEHLVEIVNRARREGYPVGTADARAAVDMAIGLAALRGAVEPGPREIFDAVRAALVKGPAERGPTAIELLAREVLTGRTAGELPAGAGRPPLVDDWHTVARTHRFDLSGALREVRCDLHKQERHRDKSAFFHRCAVLEIPMFGDLGRGGDVPHFRGPDPIHGTDLHLSIETWGIQWHEEVEDRLLEVSDRGPTIADAAAFTLRSEAAEAGTDSSAWSSVLLRAAQCRTVELVPSLLDGLLAALARDGEIARLVRALQDLVLLHGYRDALPTRGDVRVGEGIGRAFVQACLHVPSLAGTADEGAPDAVDVLQSLVRIALGVELPGGVVPDRGLLLERLRELVRDRGGHAMVRGAALGVLFAFRSVREGTVVRELRADFDGQQRGGLLLEGLLRTGRAAFLGAPRLLGAVHAVLAALDEDDFQRMLPDLRRAFSVFVPAELEAIGGRVHGLLDLGDSEDPADLPLPEVVVARAAVLDRTVKERIAPFLR